MKEKNVLLSVCKWALLALILFFLLFPLYWVLITSFKTNMEAYRATPTFFPDAPTVESYIKLFTENNEFFVYYKNNFIVSGVTALITTCLAILAGYGLSRFHFKWNGIVVAVLLSSQMFPVVSRMISLYDLMNKMKLINTLPGLILALTAAMLPFTVMLMSSFFDSVPNAVEEAAYVDGAGYFTTMVRIILPMAKPSVVTVILFEFLSYWNEYIISMTMLTDPNGPRTLPVGLLNLMKAQNAKAEYGQMYAGLVLVMVPVLILYMCVQKKLTQGMTLGGLKG